MEHSRRTDDGTYPDVTEERAKKDGRARAPIARAHDPAPARERDEKVVKNEEISPETDIATTDTDRPATNPDPQFGVLVYDRGEIRWSSFGGTSRPKAEALFLDWDRVTGPDGHRTYALGIAPFVENPQGDEIRMLVESCLMLQELARREKLNYENEIAARVLKYIDNNANEPYDYAHALDLAESGEWRNVILTDADREEFGLPPIDSGNTDVIQESGK